jgi:hypothetical protein
MTQVLQSLSSFVLCQASREISIVVAEFDLCSRLHFHCKFHLFTPSFSISLQKRSTTARLTLRVPSGLLTVAAAAASP